MDKPWISELFPNQFLWERLSTANLRLSTPLGQAHAVQEGCLRSNPSLSDRMSRSVLTLRSPHPPTASQVMTSDVTSGIIETNNLDLLAAWFQRASRGCSHDRWQVAFSFHLVGWRSWSLFQWHR